MAELTGGPVRVALVDDDPLVLTGLRMLLAGDPGIHVVAELDDGDRVLGAAQEHEPDVILLDIRMPRMDGIEATRKLLSTRSEAPAVVMLTTFDADRTVLEALRAGAAGYLVKHSPPADIVAAVHRAAAGEPVFSPSALRTLVRHARAAETTAGAPTALATLTERERRIARAVAEGRTNTDIAADLYLSTGTVKAAISAMLSKLGITNRIQLAILANQLDE